MKFTDGSQASIYSRAFGHKPVIQVYGGTC